MARPLIALASKPGISFVLSTSTGRGRNELTDPGFGEGKRDGLIESVEALEGERPTVERGIAAAWRRVSGLETDLSKDSRRL